MEFRDPAGEGGERPRVERDPRLLEDVREIRARRERGLDLEAMFGPGRGGEADRDRGLLDRLADCGDGRGVGAESLAEAPVRFVDPPAGEDQGAGGERRQP